MQHRFVKDPDATLDYGFDWSRWLEGDTIQLASVSVSPSGLTITRVDFSTTGVVVWLSGGAPGSTYLVTCRIETASGRVDERSMRLFVAHR